MDFRLINLIKLAINNNKKIIKFKIKKKNIFLIKKLITLNIIKYYKKINNLYYIYINTNLNKNAFINIYKPSKKLILNNNILNKLTFKKKWIFLLSTNKGILTNFEAINKKLGGILILKINL